MNIYYITGFYIRGGASLLPIVAAEDFSAGFDIKQIFPKNLAEISERNLV
ncbi:hypothetical protein [Dapis sp. BLCC M126]